MFSDQRTKTGRQPEICTPDFRSSRCRSSFFGLLCAALLGLSSCLQFDRTPVSSQPLTFDPGSAQCLGKSSVTLTNLVEGNGDAASVNALFDCARDSLGLFVQNVKGANPSYYAPTELRAFMEKYFLGGTTISDPLLAQTMILKTVLFGGAATQIAPAEITAALNLLETTRQQALALLPWFPLTSEHLEQLSPGDFAAAVGAIQGAIQALSNVLGTVGQSYAFSDFSAFLQDLIPILDSPDARASLASLQAQLGGISDLKQLLSPSPDAAIGGQEWAGLFGDASTAYTLWLTYWNLNARLGSFMVGDGRVAFVGWTGQLLAFLDQVVSRHGDAGVAQAELNQLASDWLGSSVTVAGFPVDLAILEQTLTPILSRVLTGDVFDSSHHRVLGSGLNHAVVAKLEQYLAEWNAGQAYVEAAFTSAGDGNQITTDGSAPAGALGLLPAQLAQLPPGDPGTGASPIAFASEQRLRELIEAPETWQLFAPSRGEISFPEPLNDRHHSFNDLTTLNWMYEIAFMLMRGYIDDPTRMPPETGALGQSLYQSGALESEVAQFYQDFKPFGVAIKLFAPDDDSVPADRFRDANLFLYASNGDNLLDPEEGQQLLAFLVSADRLADRFHFAIVADGCPTGPLDIYGWPTVDAQCYRQTLWANRATFFRDMPGLLRYYAGLGATQAASFQQFLEQASRPSGYSNAMFGQDDAQRIAAVLQYVEALFGRFDTNGDGVIDKTEAEAAFPVVESRLAQASCLTKEDELHALFTYLLKNGTPPPKGLLGDLDFLAWMVSQDYQSYTADRSRILQIIAGLSESLSSASTCPASTSDAPASSTPGQPST